MTKSSWPFVKLSFFAALAQLCLALPGLSEATDDLANLTNDCATLQDAAVRGSCERDLFTANDLMFGSGSLARFDSKYAIISTSSCANGAWLRDLEVQIEAALRLAPSLVNIPFRPSEFAPFTLTIFVTSDDSFAHAFANPKGVRPRPYIFLPCHIVRQGRAPVIHEFGHLLVRQHGSMSLREGLSDYLQFEIRPGKAASFVSAREAFNDPCLARPHLGRQSQRLLNYIGEYGVPAFSSPEEREAFYSLSHSFVSYLAERRSIKHVGALVADSLDYMTIFGRSRDQLFIDWVTRLTSGCQ